MKKIYLLLLLIYYSTGIVFCQEKKFDVNQEFCNKVNESILSKDNDFLTSHLSLRISMESKKISSLANEYSEIIDIEKDSLQHNQYTVVNYNEGNRTSYGYRWANSTNYTQFTIEVSCKKENDRYVISNILFTSYRDNLMNGKFPKQEIQNSLGLLPPPPPAIPTKSNTVLIDKIIQITNYEQYFYNYCKKQIHEKSTIEKWSNEKLDEITKSVDFKYHKFTIQNSLALYSTEELTRIIEALEILNKDNRSAFFITNPMIENNFRLLVKNILLGKYVTSK